MRISPRIAWLLLVALSSPAFAEKDATPTPTPRKHSTKHRFPAATASASPKKEPFQTETADDSDADAEPTPKKKRTKAKASATPAPEPEKTPLPDPSPSATPDSTPTPTPSDSPTKKSDYAENATLETRDLKEFAAQPAPIQRLITAALELTRQDLSYTYGSSDPANGGMDCSGFIYHVLQQEGMPEVPRDASGQYVWVRKAGTFRAVVGLKDSSFELNEMRPGDLLFWTGTYNAQKDPPVTHTMIYLGREAKTGQRVMVGSSDGRSYEGKRRWGVSVFDFKMPGPKSVQKGVDFIGYAHLPSLEKVPAPDSTASPAEAASPTPSPEPTASAEQESDSSPTATPRAKAKAKTKSKRHSRPAQ